MNTVFFIEYLFSCSMCRHVNGYTSATVADRQRVELFSGQVHHEYVISVSNRNTDEGHYTSFIPSPGLSNQRLLSNLISF